MISITGNNFNPHPLISIPVNCFQFGFNSVLAVARIGQVPESHDVPDLALHRGIWLHHYAIGISLFCAGIKYVYLACTSRTPLCSMCRRAQRSPAVGLTCVFSSVIYGCLIPRPFADAITADDYPADWPTISESKGAPIKCVYATRRSHPPRLRPCY